MDERAIMAAAGLQTLLWSSSGKELVAFWPGPTRIWFFWREHDSLQWHSVSTQGGRYYSTHDTLEAAFANAQRIEEALKED